MAVPRFELERSALLVVDMQQRLVPVMDETKQLVRRAVRMIDGANALKLPILVTEQYRKGLGTTIDELAPKLEKACCCCEKLKFSACIEPVREQLGKLGVDSVIVIGVEAHVCVLQTCLDLLAAGFTTAVVCDAISSRRGSDCAVAIQRMVQAGVVPTTVESVLLELTREAGGDRFRAVQHIIK